MSVWRTDWENAPRGCVRFLVKYRDDDDVLVTTAYFYWETASGYVDGYDAQWWALQDAVRDEPLDENGPPQDQGFVWMNIPRD